MIRKTFLTLAVVLFAVVTLMVIPVNAGEVSTQGTEQQSSQYTQEAQAFNQSDAVQYAQISWPFQKNQGEQSQQQSQEPQENNQSQSQGEQTQQYAQKQQPQNSNQGTQSQEEQSEQQQSSNQNDSQNNQESQKAS